MALDYIHKHLKNQDILEEQLLHDAEIEKYGLRNLKNLIRKYNKKISLLNN